MDASRAVIVAVTCIALQTSALADSNGDISIQSVDNLRGSRQLQPVADNTTANEYSNRTGPLLSEPGNNLPPGSLNVCEGDW